MLPARALLALACALISLILVCATEAPIGKHGQLLCATSMTGRASRFELNLPVKWVLISSGKFDVIVDNICGREGKILIGELLEVCDIYPPEITAKPWPAYTPVAVHRRVVDDNPSQVSVHVTQFCEEV